MTLTLPIKVVSEANMRGHWAAKANRAKRQRKAAWAYLLADNAPRTLPATITLTRIAPRMLDDDNLAGAFKAVRDGVADYFQVDDGDPRYRWRYDQRPGKRGVYEIEILITPANGASDHE